MMKIRKLLSKEYKNEQYKMINRILNKNTSKKRFAKNYKNHLKPSHRRISTLTNNKSKTKKQKNSKNLNMKHKKISKIKLKHL